MTTLVRTAPDGRAIAAARRWVSADALIGAALGATAVLRSAPGRAWGSTALCLFAVLTAVTIISISWSLQPSASWVESNRAISYLAAFGGALALARLLPER